MTCSVWETLHNTATQDGVGDVVLIQNCYFIRLSRLFFCSNFPLTERMTSKMNVS